MISGPVFLYMRRSIFTKQLKNPYPLDKTAAVIYNIAIFYERTVNTMTISKKYQMPQKNSIIKHGVCPKRTAMC